MILNWRLLSHPMNWIVVFMMIFIALVFFHFIAQGITGKKSQTAGSNGGLSNGASNGL